MTDDKPAFEVRVGDHVFKIWSNGKTEGFGPDAIIVNRIPLVAR